MRVGIDVGGTHTDAVILDGSQVLASVKQLTSENVRDGVFSALDAVLESAQISHECVQAVMIGTTQFTNAVVERRELQPTAVIRAALPSGAMTPPMVDWPDDIAQAVGRHAFMIHGGQTYDGFPIGELDESELDRVLDSIEEKGLSLVAISSVFAPSNPTQERLIGERVKQRLPDAQITLSHRIGGMGLLERENAAILNTSLLPLATKVIKAFEQALAERGMGCPFFVSQNDGTLMSADFAAEFPALTFASGPTNSLRGASLLTERSDALVVDIGGTTSDIGVLQGGFPRQSNVAIAVGGVRTNFRMPDIQALGLGGGSVVSEDGSQIGPTSVGYKLPQEGRIFGGETLTSTDIAVASGAASFGDPSNVDELPAEVIERATQTMHQMIDRGIDQMRSSSSPVPVILVGGGSILISRQLETASELLRPEYAAVANAIGAANAQIGREIEKIVSYRSQSREEILKELAAILTQELTDAGADPESVRIADVEETAISYLAEESSKLRIKMVGDLKFTGDSKVQGPNPGTAGEEGST
ncbi:MAG: hydantoinase/oxoprolinase family protein [Pseudomonadota bacterium]